MVIDDFESFHGIQDLQISLFAPTNLHQISNNKCYTSKYPYIPKEHRNGVISSDPTHSLLLHTHTSSRNFTTNSIKISKKVFKFFFLLLKQKIKQKTKINFMQTKQQQKPALLWKTKEPIQSLPLCASKLKL